MVYLETCIFDFYCSSMRTLFLIVLLIGHTKTIGIVLFPDYPRCMFSAIKNPDEILYINLFFPPIPKKQPN